MEEIFIIILLMFGTIFGCILMWKFFDMVRGTINNKSRWDEDKFERLARAFIQHRNKTDERLQNIEAILAGDEPRASGKSQEKAKTSSRQSIEIEDHIRDEADNENGNLRNMLNKDRTSS